MNSDDKFQLWMLGIFFVGSPLAIGIAFALMALAGVDIQ